jgi:hypothetical protein
MLCVLGPTRLDGDELSTRPPKLLDPTVDAASKVNAACRLVAEYALTVEGAEQIEEAGQVARVGGNTWTVQYGMQGYQVTIHAFTKDETLEKNATPFDRIDIDENGRIDADEFLRRAVRTYCSESLLPHVDDHRLNDVADLLRRIDKRVGSLE